MTKGRKPGPGRRPLSPLESAIRGALAARRRYREAKAQYDAALAIDPGDDPTLMAGKREVAEDRMALARQIEKHRLKALASKDPDETARIRKKERHYRSELNALPPLGHSYDSWNALPAEARKRPVGKQPMPLDLTVHRLELEWEAAHEAFKQEAKRAGVWPIDLDTYRDPAVQAKGKLGRPPKDRLGELDAELRLLKRWIREVEALPDEAFLPPAEGKGGRTPIPRHERIARYEKRIAKIRDEIERREKLLSPLDILRRRRKLLRDERYSLGFRRARRGEAAEKAKRLAELDEAIAALTAQIEELEALASPDANAR